MLSKKFEMDMYTVGQSTEKYYKKQIADVDATYNEVKKWEKLDYSQGKVFQSMLMRKFLRSKEHKQQKYIKSLVYLPERKEI